MNPEDVSNAEDLHVSAIVAAHRLVGLAEKVATKEAVQDCLEVTRLLTSTFTMLQSLLLGGAPM